LNRLGLIQGMQNTLDDVLSLTIENLLERRLQTLVWKRGLAKSPYQARQMISHGHIALNQRRITIPSYIVSPSEEGSLSFSDGSSFFKMTQAPAAADETVSEAPAEESPAPAST
jgi:small subunit ribosomal protein S4